MRYSVLWASVVMATALTCASSECEAQWVDADALPHIRGGELIGLSTIATNYGLRTGTGLMWLAGRLPNDGAPETYWILPGALAAGSLTAALLIHHYHPLRRGRAFSAGAGALFGYVTSLSIATTIAGESFPSVELMAGPATWIGNTVGLVGGILVGHFTDAPPGHALYVATGVFGGSLLGLLSCGISQCGTNLGPFVLVGEGVGTLVALSTVNLLRPRARHMQMLSLGASGGLVPAVGVAAAYWVRDGGLSQAAIARVSAFAMGGIVVGALAGYAIGRTMTPGSTTTSMMVIPGVVSSNGASVGMTLAGEM
jgi:hypothetical protein